MFGCGSVVCTHKYKHLRIHPCPHTCMRPTSVAHICCSNSGTHRLNNSRLSLLPLLAASTVDLHTKHTQTNIISSPSSCYPPHLHDHVFIIVFHLSIVLIGLSRQHFSLLVDIIKVSIGVIDV